jgi:hypothetical protein
MINWFANQSIYGTAESRGTASESDHRRSPRRDSEARHRRGIGAADREGSRASGRTRAPLLRVQGRSPDRDGRSGRRGPTPAAARRARRARSGACAGTRARLPLHRATRRSHAQRAVRRDRRRGAASTAAPSPLRRPECRDRRRADGDARSIARLPGAARRQRRPGNAFDQSDVRGGCLLAIRSRRDQPAPVPPHGRGAGRPSPRSRSTSWKN